MTYEKEITSAMIDSTLDHKVKKEITSKFKRLLDAMKGNICQN